MCDWGVVWSINIMISITNGLQEMCDGRVEWRINIMANTRAETCMLPIVAAIHYILGLNPPFGLFAY